MAVHHSLYSHVICCSIGLQILSLPFLCGTKIWRNLNIDSDDRKMINVILKYMTESVIIVCCIQEKPGSIPGKGTDYPDSGFHCQA